MFSQKGYERDKDQFEQFQAGEGRMEGQSCTEGNKGSPLVPNFDPLPKTVVNQQPTEHNQEQTSPKKPMNPQQERRFLCTETKESAIKEDVERAKKWLAAREERKRIRNAKKQEEESHQKAEDKNAEELLNSWWFFTPEWPPADFDYSAKLVNRKMRKINPKDWSAQEELDENGNQKVYELPLHSGVFIDSKAQIIDNRPREECAAYEDLKKKTKNELLELFIQACSDKEIASS